MPNLYKPRYTKADPETGERVAKRVRKWYGKYRDSYGKIRVVPLCEDKQSAQAMLTDIVRSVEREKAGIIDPAANHLSASIASHVEKYRAHLEGKARSASHVTETIRVINKIVDECRINVLSELQAADQEIEKYLTGRRQRDASHRTINADLTAIRSFCRWLIRGQRIHRDPTASLQGLNVAEDRRKERRALTDEESDSFISATKHSEKVFRKLSGQERAMLYLLALRSGLRRNELRSLTSSSFNFTATPATVTVQAVNSKRRRLDRLPLDGALASVMKEFLDSRPTDKHVWPGSWWRRSAEMIRLDLTDAGIPVTDPDERIVDFHALRTTFITNLSRVGVAPALAQKLARHSDIKLTMGTYTQLDMAELGQAVDRLPSIQMGTDIEKAEEPEAGTIKQLSELTEVWRDLSQEVRSGIMKLVRQARR